jgi:hypothetical protein
MNRRPFDTRYPLLNWVLQQGQETLAVRVSQAGKRYQVSVSSLSQNTRLYAEAFQGGRNALRFHAALVAGFRDAGWRTVAYR